jgi:nucleoside phosphorylase
MNGPPCVVVALGRELLGLRAALRPWRRQANAPCRSWEAGAAPVLVVESGIGLAAAERAVSWVAESRRPAVVLSAGFSGALTGALRVGDLVLGTEVVGPDGETWPATWTPAAVPPVPRGRLVTVAALVGAPADKRRLGERTGALAADMEAAAVARACRRHAIPFGCLRVISDGVETALSPELLGLLDGGRVRPGRLVAALLRRPGLVAELWRLGRDTRRAARRLGEGLTALLAGPGSGD